MKKLATVFAILLGSAGAAQAVEGNPAAGQQAAAVCFSCHGQDGNSQVPTWPKLAGQHAEYIVKQLKDFKSGARQDQTMTGMAAPLTEQQMADIAVYFAARETSIGSANPEAASLGEQLYRGGNQEKGLAACMACHGPSGVGNSLAGFPRLSGQHATYVAKALKDFKTGVRTNDTATMMQDIAAKMTDQEIEAVAEYVSGLH